MTDRILAALYELPGRAGFDGCRAVRRGDVADVLDAPGGGPLSEGAARAAYQARIAARAASGGGGS